MTSSEEAYLRKAEALLHRASDPSASEGEREACIGKANQIMEKHRLDRAMLFSSGKQPDKKIVQRVYDRVETGQFSYLLADMRSDIFRHCGVMTHRSYKDTAVGYEEDMFFAEMLWSTVYLHFVERMFPKWEKHRTFDANVYSIKKAGYSWSEVREMGLAQGAGDLSGPLTAKNAGSKLRNAFKREAARRGEVVPPGKQQPLNPVQWRKNFAEAYASRMYARLRQLRMENAQEPGSPGEIALLTDEDRVKQEFWKVFPDMHPEAQKRLQERFLEQERRRQEGLTPAQKAEEERKIERRRQEYLKRWDQEHRAGGWNDGAQAADEVNLSRASELSEAERMALE